MHYLYILTFPNKKMYIGMSDNPGKRSDTHWRAALAGSMLPGPQMSVIQCGRDAGGGGNVHAAVPACVPFNNSYPQALRPLSPSLSTGCLWVMRPIPDVADSRLGGAWRGSSRVYEAQKPLGNDSDFPSSQGRAVPLPQVAFCTLTRKFSTRIRCRSRKKRMLCDMQQVSTRRFGIVDSSQRSIPRRGTINGILPESFLYLRFLELVSSIEVCMPASSSRSLRSPEDEEMRSGRQGLTHDRDPQMTPIAHFPAKGRAHLLVPGKHVPPSSILPLENALWRGDVETFLKALPCEPLFDLVVTSPPYNIGKEYETRVELDRYLEWQERVIAEIIPRLKAGGSLCWQVGNYIDENEIFPLDIEFAPIFKKHKPQLRNRIVWQFGHGLHTQRRFSGRYEVVLWYTNTRSSKDGYVFNLDAILPSTYPRAESTRSTPLHREVSAGRTLLREEACQLPPGVKRRSSQI